MKLIQNRNFRIPYLNKNTHVSHNPKAATTVCSAGEVVTEYLCTLRFVMQMNGSHALRKSCQPRKVDASVRHPFARILLFIYRFDLQIYDDVLIRY